MSVIPKALWPALQAGGNIGQTQQAHTLLLNAGYQFVGYHGCNLATQNGIVPLNFDVSRIGSGAGLARGRGFYVARRRGLAEDNADSITQDDPVPPHYNVVRLPGNAGVPAMLRIYALNFNLMTAGRDYMWGIQNSDGDPNGDRAPRALTRLTVQQNRADQEILFAPAMYGRLAALPSLGDADDSLYLPGNPAMPAAYETGTKQHALGIQRRPNEAPF